MIALTLLFVTGIYLGLLVLALWKPEGWWKAFWAAVVLSPVAYYTWDIPVGYYHFQKLCKAEAGLKIYVPNPAQAKRIRLDGHNFSGTDAEEFLKVRPTLEQIEAKDKKIDYSIPPAYALYERNADGQVVSTLIDKVGRPQGGDMTVLEAAPSQAEYNLEFERKYPSLRSSFERLTLRRSDGFVIGTSTWINYKWSIPTVWTNRCGYDALGYRKLLDLISTPLSSNTSRK